jgi:hypothetical protein
MEKHQITQEKEFIKIGEVILTEHAIATLENLQEDSNAYINEFLEILGNTVCFLAKTKQHWSGSFATESESLVEQLSFLHGNLKELKRPIENKILSKLEENAKRDWENK